MIQRAIALLDAQSAEHKADVYGMFSGGDDSMACLLVTTQAKRFRAAVHLDTGIGIQETRDFVAETCRREGWPLLVFKAKDCGQDYEALALRYGFPGPGQHWRMYARLKERALRAFVRSQKTHRHQRLILSTGARSRESDRRMGHVQPVRRDGVKVWVNPLHDWQKYHCHEYISSRGLPRNEVVELLHMSGECLCGSFAKPGELAEIALWYPKTAAHIRAIEAKVQAAGVAACQWGAHPTRKKGQRDRTRDSAGRISELCQSCQMLLPIEASDAG